MGIFKRQRGLNAPVRPFRHTDSAAECDRPVKSLHVVGYSGQGLFSNQSQLTLCHVHFSLLPAKMSQRHRAQVKVWSALYLNAVVGIFQSNSYYITFMDLVWH